MSTIRLTDVFGFIAVLRTIIFSLEYVEIRLVGKLVNIEVYFDIDRLR